MADRKLPDHITEQPDGSLLIALGRGIDIDGTTVKALTMREPTVADEIAADAVKGSKAAQEVAFIANLCEITPADLHKATSRDYRRLQDGLALFFG